MSDISNKITPARFEFRIFGRDLKYLQNRLSELSDPVPDRFKKRSSQEFYLLSLTNDTCNCKIRDRKIDIKAIVSKRDKLERWDVVLKADFPLDRRVIVKEVFPAMWTRSPMLDPGVYDIDGMLAIAGKHKDLQPVTIDKIRFGYSIKGTFCEFAEVFVNGARIETVAVESENPDVLVEVAEMLNIYHLENLNYPAALKRVMGLDGLKTIL